MEWDGGGGDGGAGFAKDTPPAGAQWARPRSACLGFVFSSSPLLRPRTVARLAQRPTTRAARHGARAPRRCPWFDTTLPRTARPSHCVALVALEPGDEMIGTLTPPSARAGGAGDAHTSGHAPVLRADADRRARAPAPVRWAPRSRWCSSPPDLGAGAVQAGSHRHHNAQILRRHRVIFLVRNG